MKIGVLLVALPLLVAQSAVLIEGTASNKVTHAGIPGVILKLESLSKRVYTCTSDAGGAFHIAGVPDGDYTATVEAPPGFLEPRPWPVHVAAESKPPALQISLLPLATLRGLVVDAERRPVPGVRVELFRVYYAGGDLMITDSEGRFVADRLVPGAYRLRARPVLAGTPLAARIKSVSPLPAKSPEGERWQWAPTYFPDAIEMSSAATIAVREGAELSGYEIRLRSAPVYRLGGRVLDDEGLPAGGVTLWLLSEIGWGSGEAQVTSGGDGRFEFPAVRAGRWRISAEAVRGAITWKGFSELTMPQRDLGNALVRIAPPFSLDGVVEAESPAPRARVTVGLSPVPHGESSWASQEPGATLHFEDLYPGTYRIDPRTTLPGHYLSSILLGGQDVTGQSVYLGPGSPPIRVIYKPNAARVQGAVEDGAGVKVVLIQADRERYTEGQSLRVAVCDREGRYTIEGLRPTTYHAFAFDIVNLESEALEELVFSRGLDRQGKTLHLGEGETVTLDLKVTPWPD